MLCISRGGDEGRRCDHRSRRRCRCAGRWSEQRTQPDNGPKTAGRAESPATATRHAPAMASAHRVTMARIRGFDIVPTEGDRTVYAYGDGTVDSIIDGRTSALQARRRAGLHRCDRRRWQPASLSASVVRRGEGGPARAGAISPSPPSTARICILSFARAQQVRGTHRPRLRLATRKPTGWGKLWICPISV